MYLNIGIAIALIQCLGQANGENGTLGTSFSTNTLVSNMMDTARTLEIGSIDFQAIIDRLISPSGLVTQFALELEFQIIFTLGWIVLGKQYGLP